MRISCQKIREKRRQKDFSQEYVAYILGISQSQYSKLENGSKVFDIDTLSKLLDILEISPLEIIDFSDKQKFFIDNDRKIQVLTNQDIRNTDGGFSFMSVQRMEIL